MRETYRTFGYLAGLVLVLVGASYAQSLGDVARQQRQNQQAKKDPAKVITNDDLPQRLDPSDSDKTEQDHDTAPHARSAKSAEQWRAQIEAQEHSIATLQSQMERLNSTIRFAENASSYNAPRYNQRQEQKQDKVQQMQEQLDQQRKRLEEMQEAARKDGYGNAVYEP